ncbi:tail fiber protein [Chitinophaga sp. XS-30]|uniref:tail fiber protein n=1 Tax=Chitinophaga sp. XS-30 TaxID=2604421 RepID=UPI0011DCC8C3|nr:tail fiber protein [Chitinophaga sp. XS-30]QEH40277.1 hypothetical protein FW415_05075 [Chitinophaga sp. XS-30]
MKKRIVGLIFLCFFASISLFAQTVTYNWNGVAFGVNGEPSERYTIGRIYYNAIQWGYYSTIKIKLRSKWYRAGYAEYMIMNGPNFANSYCITSYGPGTDHVRITLGPQTSAGSSAGGGENYYKDIYLDAGYYTLWYAEAEATGQLFSMDRTSITAGEYYAATLYSSPAVQTVAAFAEHKRVMFTSGSATAYFHDKVGIGTLNPQASLAVNGDILAKKVKVSTAAANWPDYVFKEEYKLPSLAEVEAFVTTHHHLPGVPSAAQVATDGQDIGEINRLLLQKMEEMTLYMINQDKIIKSLEKRITQIETPGTDSLSAIK